MTPNQSQSPEYHGTFRTRDDDAATLSANRARQSVKIGTMRYVLAISTLGAIAVLVVAYFLIAG